MSLFAFQQKKTSTIRISFSVLKQLCKDGSLSILQRIKGLNNYDVFNQDEYL